MEGVRGDWPLDLTGGLMSKKRFKMGRHQSNAVFRRNAMRVHPKNAKPLVMRGGIRL